MPAMRTINLSDSLSKLDLYQPPLVARCAIWLAVTLTEWDMKQRTRRQLAGLDDRQLRDIGIERDAADTEAARPFWR
ncbi:hypothetical protein PEL8287_00369 [Roseovarius litorisediminis]|uniref:YjiS-like domain-containing protein n=1 Tax=Roseovarius litorisediminis TaxID=1312363 RepID=A0A1Y5RB07_9RHOB|nr:DUF1127 domain-containing protein [Roseovarius litorisediminis]SLN12502.1 hypothetical protein PEL8287_00369 [Roseovarius litorisediminis]